MGCLNATINMKSISATYYDLSINKMILNGEPSSRIPLSERLSVLKVKVKVNVDSYSALS